MNSSGENRAGLSAAVVFAAALALRLGHVLALRDSPYFARPVLDAETYYWAARTMAAGEGWAEAVYWQPPGYPYFLAAILRLAGPGFLAPRLVQAVLGALTAALTCAIGTRVFGRAVGLGAGLVVALYGVLIYYDGELLAPSLAICLQMATLYCAARAPAERGGRGWLATGLLGGLTAVVNALALVLLPILAIAARRRAGWLLLGAAIAIAPVTLRNWTEGRELVLISSNTGINLYLGNNPRYDATVGMRPGRDWQALVRAPRLHGVTGAGPASRFFVERVTAYAACEPVGFLLLQARKLRLLLGGAEIPRNQELYPTRDWSPVLRILLWKVPGLAFPFGVLLPLAVVGLGVAWPRAPVLAASVVLLGLAVAVYLLANLGQGPMPYRMNSDAEQGLAHWLEREGHRPEAFALYGRLTRETPASFDAWYGVAQLARVLGQPAEAAAARARIGGLEPEFLDTTLLLARAGLEAGCGAEAEAFARRAMALDGRSDLARALLRDAQTLRASRRGGPPGGCPDRVFVAPFALTS